jgi:acyl-CoA synthetase (AMP-forming)/AMP-acid ligase II
LKNIIDVLKQHATKEPGKVAYIFLDKNLDESECVTYAALDTKVAMVSSYLRSKYSKGDRVLLLIPEGVGFVVCFFACLSAGLIAVPAYPPQSRRNQFDRINNLISDSLPKLILTSDGSMANSELMNGLQLNGVDILSVNELSRLGSKDFLKYDIDSRDVAFLQYTSGSTGDPKGVIITHRNMMDNVKVIKKAFDLTNQSIIVGWLPLFHDMGLIGNMLSVLYSGGQVVLMSPMTFLQKPVNWLKAIDKYNATVSGGPNFAYDFCVEKITAEDMIGIRLNKLKIAFNGAEPVRKNTLEAFAEKFGSYGFKKQAFLPCYGLAEATLFVSGKKVGTAVIYHEMTKEKLAGLKSLNLGLMLDYEQTFVSSGRVYDRRKIIIINPRNNVKCLDGQVGEILINSASTSKGYWNKPSQYMKHGQYSKTGDIGFIIDNELYVCGRLKELIIVRGKNYYPSDLEEIVQSSHVALRSGFGACFSVAENGHDKIIVLQEVRRDHIKKLQYDEVKSNINNNLTSKIGIKPDLILFLKPGSIPKTSSGKIKRVKLARQYLECKDSLISASLGYSVLSEV